MRLLLGAMALLLVAPAVAAQVDPVGTLAFDPPLDGRPRIAIEPAVTSWAVPWRFTFSSAAHAAAAAVDGAEIDWALGQCFDGVALHAEPTPIDVQPGTTEYTGVAELGFSARPGTLGMQALPCELTGTVAGAQDNVPEAAATKPIGPVVEYVGGITALVVDDHKASGPQKQIPYQVEVTNFGNARTQVAWEVVDDPSGRRWNAIVPEVILLEPGETKAGVFTVATPFHQGYNSDRGTYILRLLPSSADDPTQTAAPVEVEMSASAKGWYIPGPSPALLFAVLALAALAVRRLG